MDNKPFKDAALAQAAIFSHLQMSSVEAPSSIYDIHNALKDDPHVKNLQQISDYIKRLRDLKLVLRIREGKMYKYWLADNAQMPPTGQQAANVTKQKVKYAKTNEGIATAFRESFPMPVIKQIDVPQIKITDSLITISHSKYKLTLELA